MLGNLRSISLNPANSAAAPSPTAPLKQSYSASAGTVSMIALTPLTHDLGVGFLGFCASKLCNRLGRKRTNVMTDGCTPLSIAHSHQSSRLTSNSSSVSRSARCDSTRLAPARSSMRLPVLTNATLSAKAWPCNSRASMMLAMIFCISAAHWPRSSRQMRVGTSGSIFQRSGSLYLNVSSELPMSGTPKSSTRQLGAWICS